MADKTKETETSTKGKSDSGKTLPTPLVEQDKRTLSDDEKDALTNEQFQLGLTDKNAEGKTREELREAHIKRTKEQRKKLEANSPKDKD